MGRLHRSWAAILVALLATIGLSGGVGHAAEVNSWEEIIATVDALDAGGSAELSIASDIEAQEGTQPLTVREGRTLTLTGSGQLNGPGAPLITVEKGGSLTLAGPTFRGVQFAVAGDLNFNAGAIRDTKVTGPVIFVDGGSLIIGGTADFSQNSVADETGELNPAGVEKEKYAPITAYNGTVRVEGGTLTDNSGLRYGGVIGLWARDGEKPSFEMTGGTLQGNKVSHPKYNGRGGAVYGDGAVVAMSGGSLKENTTEQGAALAFIDSDVTMSGGVLVQGNNNGDYKGFGGGLFQHGGTLKIQGATFKENVSTSDGGAIYTEGDAKVDITGAEITSNTAARSGGGIAFMGTTKATLYAADLRDNTSTGFWGGGAMYNDTKTEVRIYNGLIRDNVIKPGFLVQAGNHPVSAQGGGVWNCPTGSTVMHVNRGVAIFDNVAPNVVGGKNAGAGDDFASIIKHESGEPVEGHSVVVTDRMLGGSPRQWFQDGSIYSIHSNWSEEGKVPRYSEEGPNTAIESNKEVTENIAFKSVPSEDAKAIAERLATVRIVENTATGTGISGAGIANNGKLTFGEPDPWTVKVAKTWVNDEPTERPEGLLLDVKLGDKVLETVKLDKANGWEAELSNYPDPKTLIDAKTGETIPLTFVEHAVDGYMSHTPVVTFNEATRTYEVALRNEPPTSIDVRKEWSGDAEEDRPEAIVVKLLADGEETGKTLELTAEDGWHGKFEGLPKYKTVDEQRTEIKYSVLEVDVPGYESSVSGDAESGFVLKNSKDVPPPTETTEVPPPTETTDVPPTETTDVPPTETTDVPPTETTDVPPTETTDVPPTETTTVPPTETTDVPPTETTTEPPTETTTVPPTETTTVPPTTDKPLARTGVAVSGLVGAGVRLLGAGALVLARRRG